MAVESGLFGLSRELATWTASLSEAAIETLTESGFVPVDAEVTAYGCPCVLVRPIPNDRIETEWTFGDRRLLDATNWDVRMLYSMQG